MFRIIQGIAAGLTACFIVAGVSAVAASPVAAQPATTNVHQAVCQLTHDGMSTTSIVHNLQIQGDHNPTLALTVATNALNC